MARVGSPLAVASQSASKLAGPQPTASFRLRVSRAQPSHSFDVHFLPRTKNSEICLGYPGDCAEANAPDTVRVQPSVKTLRELYLAQRQIEPAHFEEHMLRRALYPHARVLLGLMSGSTRRHYFGIDLEFIRAIGQLRRRRDFRNECSEFMRDPSNRKFARKAWRRRVSGHRTRQMVDDLFGASESMPPMGREPGA